MGQKERLYQQNATALYLVHLALSAELEAVEPKIAKLTTEWEKAAEEVEKVAAAG